MRLLLSLVVLAAPLAAQTPAAQTVAPEPAAARSVRALGAVAVEPGAIDLDGRLDEAVWQQATAAVDFVQNRPGSGQPATERTEARVLYDGAALYVGMRMHDSQPDAIAAPLGRRDAGLTSDWASVALDSYHDRRSGFVFGLNPAGVQRDALLFDDVNEDDSWDAVWSGAVSRDADGWTAEFKIPLSQLRYTPAEGDQEWGVQFVREINRTGEQVFWAPTLPEDNGIVSLFGTLQGLRGLRAPRRLELLPYVASSLTRAPGDDADPFYSANDAEPRLGLDLTYGLTGNLTLAATINPDFGQVEADPAQVNLGGFEQSFGERRPFFVEGRDAFSTQPRRFFSTNRPSLLYTRRIGRSPRRTRFVPGDVSALAGEAGSVYTDAPQQSTILGAAKLSGRVGPFSVGVLDAVTSREYGRFQAFGPDRQPLADGQALVEPLTNYGVARARGTFGSTIVGGLLTSVVRESGTDALAEMLPRQATVAGLDLEHRLGEQWIVTGQVAGSVVSGSTDAITRVQAAFPRLFQRPDARYATLDTTRTRLAGVTGEVNLLKVAGEHWVAGVQAQTTSPGFDANELGFQSRAGDSGVGGVVVYQQNKAQGPFQSWNAQLFSGSGWNYDGDHTNAFVGTNLSGRLKSFWSAELHAEAWPRTTGDRTTRGGPLATDPAGGEVGGSVSTDGRKKVSGYAWTGMNRTELGGWYHGVSVGVEARPASAVQLSLGTELDREHDARQYVGTFSGGPAATFGQRYVFGRLDQTTVSIEARADWAFTPTLTLQMYARPYVSRGRYDGFQQMTAPGQLDFPTFSAAEVARSGDGVTVTPADGGDPFSLSPDFTVRAIQGNAVLRWQYRPGSALFVVWQQQREGYDADGVFRLGRRGGFFNDPVTNVFLVKLSYWLG